MFVIPSKIHVAVLLGGFSAEREVSLRSGKAAVEALRSKGFRVTEVDVQDLQFRLPPETDVAFLTLHGTGGEDGQIQEILEKQGVVFTGSDSRASRIAFDKVEAKKIFRETGLETPRDVVVRRKDLDGLPSHVELRLPRVVKPARQGSSIGVRFVQREEEMEGALLEALQNDETALVEEFIEGREFTVGILDEKVLPVIEICPKEGWYDYTNKYTKGATEYLVPAPLEKALAQRIQEQAWKAHQALGCRDVSRSDFRVDNKGQTFLLEVNTLPGMTETSLLPKAAAAIGIAFSDLCFTLVECALKRR